MIMSLLLSLGGLTLPQGEVGSWCQHPAPGNHALSKLNGASIEHVKLSSLESAVRMLSDRSAIRISKRTYKNFVAEGGSNHGRNFIYLARAGVMVRKGLTDVELAQEGRAAGYRIYKEDDDSAVRIASILFSGPVDQVPIGYPVILISPKPIKRVVAVCFGGA